REHRPLVPDEMQRIGHDDAVESGKRQWAGEVSPHDIQLCRREPSPHRICKLTQRPRLAIDGGDVGARPKQVGECERERTLAGSKVRPPACCRIYSVAKETY